MSDPAQAPEADATNPEAHDWPGDMAYTMRCGDCGTNFVAPSKHALTCWRCRCAKNSPPLAQPAPAETRDIEEQVCEDILARQKVGIAKYGVTVAQNPLTKEQWRTHLYQELLDACIYLKAEDQSASPARPEPAEEPLHPELRAFLASTKRVSAAEMEQLRVGIEAALKEIADEMEAPEPVVVNQHPTSPVVDQNDGSANDKPEPADDPRLQRNTRAWKIEPSGSTRIDAIYIIDSDNWGHIMSKAEYALEQQMEGGDLECPWGEMKVTISGVLLSEQEIEDLFEEE